MPTRYCEECDCVLEFDNFNALCADCAEECNWDEEADEYYDNPLDRGGDSDDD